jgi:CRISPR-associated endoribonuclease Cas6
LALSHLSSRAREDQHYRRDGQHRDHHQDGPTPRKSGRTGQVHPIGGFTSEAEYVGPLAEFLPWLRAARWVGVGRQTVWGKGDLRVL